MREFQMLCGLMLGLVAPLAVPAEREVSVTIYADDLALVQDHRTIDVAGGRQRIEFQDVSAQIRPETVSLAASDLTRGRTLGNNGAVAVDFKPR